MSFDIPPEPLRVALAAFGAAAGLDVFYNAAFTDGRRSAGVRGHLTPGFALQRLLDGSGLVAQMTGPVTFTVVPAPRQMPPRPTAPAVLPAPGGTYDTYFASLQARISEALCHDPATRQDGGETLLRVWFAPAGTIGQVEMLLRRGGTADGRSVIEAVQGLAVGAPPPGMPQPVTLVVLAPNAIRRPCE